MPSLPKCGQHYNNQLCSYLYIIHTLYLFPHNNPAVIVSRSSLLTCIFNVQTTHQNPTYKMHLSFPGFCLPSRTIYIYYVTFTHFVNYLSLFIFPFFHQLSKLRCCCSRHIFFLTLNHFLRFSCFCNDRTAAVSSSLGLVTASAMPVFLKNCIFFVSQPGIGQM